MSKGKVYDIDRQSGAEISALAAAIGSYSSQANKDKLEFIYGHNLHSGMSAAAALAQAIRMTT